jgi:hypothetical protein
MDDEYEIELNMEDFAIHPCGCCENQSVTIWGYVTHKSKPYAVYYFGMAEHHDHAEVLVSWGGWGVDPVGTKQFVAIRMGIKEDSVTTTPSSISEMPGYSGRVSGLGDEVSEDEIRQLKDGWWGPYLVMMQYDPRVVEMIADGQGTFY